MAGVCIISPGGAGGVQAYSGTVEAWLRSKRPGVAVHAIDPRGARAWHTLWRLPLAVCRLARLAARGGTDVAHIQVTERMSFARKGVMAAAARALGLRVVVHHHGAELAPFYRGRGPLGRWLLRRVLALAEVNLVLGGVWARLLIEEAGVAPERLAILPNGIADAPVARGRRIGGLHVLFLAVMTPRKGATTLLAALAELRRRGVDVSATLAGDGPGFAEVARETRRLGLSDRVALPGWVEPGMAQKLMARADVFVCASSEEGLPIAILEALRAALPVVSTPVGAIPEAAPELDFFPVGDAAALADRLEALARDAAARRAKGREARRLYEARFTLDRHMARLLAIYGWDREEADARAAA